ncbi:MAG: S-layer homology domain-containing protein, partial [Deltaproteobacteria bacterium]
MFQQLIVHKRILLIAFMLLGMVIATRIPPAEAATITTNTDKPPAKTIFNDVSNIDPNLIYINYLNQRNIMKGFSDGSYHPQEGLTRAQAAVVVAKAAGLNPVSPEKSSFTDVPLDHWAAAYIESARNAGYISGFPDETYRPDDKLTRTQGISLIMRLSKEKERAVLPIINDMKEDHWAAGDMATAMELNMIGISRNGTQVYPDAKMTRSNFARALSILLTRDPVLCQTKLTGKAKGIIGTVSLTRNGISKALKDDMIINEGDIIRTDRNAKTQIEYPDGSSSLIEENSELIIKRSDGRNYIKQDGTPGVAIEFLDIEMKQGTLFGALATKRQEEQTTEENKESAISKRLASLGNLRLLAAGEQRDQPWYRTAEKKKVKVRVDMPWGVAAIRGTFYKVTVNQDGSCKVACLTGSAEVTSNSGSTVALTANQNSAITSEANNPAPAGNMSKDEVKAFTWEQQWIVNTSINIDVCKEAVYEIIIEVPGTEPQENNPENAQQNIQHEVVTTLEVIIDALSDAGINLNSETIESIKNQLQQIQEELNPYQNQDIVTKIEQSNNTNQTSSDNTSNNTVYNSSSISPTLATFYNTSVQTDGPITVPLVGNLDCSYYIPQITTAGVTTDIDPTICGFNAQFPAATDDAK